MKTPPVKTYILFTAQRHFCSFLGDVVPLSCLYAEVTNISKLADLFLLNNASSKEVESV